MQNEMKREEGSASEERSALKERRANCEKEKSRKTNMDFL